MSKNELWFEGLSIGKRGEALTMAALTKKGYWVEDVADQREYQQIDIDFIVEGTTVEVKNDLKSNYTNNIFVELTNENNYSRGGKGWAHYCEAAFMAFVQEKKGLIHFVERTELLKEAVRYPIKSSSEASGYCVPVAAIQKLSSYKCLECDVVC